MPRTTESIAIIITTAASTTPTINPGETLLLLPLPLLLVDSSSAVKQQNTLYKLQTMHVPMLQTRKNIVCFCFEHTF